ncbi:MAG: ATPase AAA [Candidatus Tectimicrobiota bacterium]|nr:MAG: ATPase AAA [Candidatus Tectomicrobia bacterium]
MSPPLSSQPLAARMRPRTLDEFVGQEHIVGPGRLLRRAIEADQLSSLIFYGPPGTGKTTLAMIIANTTRSHFITLNAVLAGVADIRQAIAQAQQRYQARQQRTILFIDEVHRFNKAQQDALLPHVENGTILLIGATVENPYFAVNRALTSRSRIFQLKPLSDDDLRRIVLQALRDPERGYGKRAVDLHPDALAHLVKVANGDARAVLNALELAVETTPPNAEGVIVVDMAVAEESIQQRAVLYDKEGDYHYDTISAFIKSLRGSDPDAAMYWLAKMVYAGEDPRFLFRRMLIFASEDVGLADPQAIQVTLACAEAFERIGLPEGRFALAQAALYLATAPKSNSVFAFFDALRTVEEEREGEVPAHLKDASRDAASFGHGAGYLYPHAYREHWVAQQYLPAHLQGKVFYEPGNLGYERRLRRQVIRRREAQLAAMLEMEPSPAGEVLTYSKPSRARDQWLQRAIGRASAHLAALRDRLLDAAALQRHSLVLDLNATTGLLTWEALRRVPEGGVWALTGDARAAQALEEQAARLPALERPTVLVGELMQLPALLRAHGAAEVRFDAAVGRNVLTRCPDRAGALRQVHACLRRGGRLVLAEVIPRRGQRLSALVDTGELDPALRQRLLAAEAALYQDAEDVLVNWDVAELEAALQAAGFRCLQPPLCEVQEEERCLTAAHLDRWFGRDTPGTYASRLRRWLTADELACVEACFRRQLLEQVVPWRTTFAVVVALAE